MMAYLIRRLLLTVFVLWGVGSLVFAVLRLAPGDPAALQLGITATHEQIAEFRHRTGLDRPIGLQYVTFLADASRLDFGDSTVSDAKASTLVLQRLPYTIGLAISAMALALILSFPLGMLAARSAGGPLDRGVSFLSISGQALPSFWVGVMLILVFSRDLKLFPSGGTGTLLHLVLPAVTLAAPLASVLTRLIRSGLIGVADEGYLQTARAKGMSERDVLIHHALPNVMIPVVTVAGLQFGHLLGGAVVVEVVFAWPGIGQLLVDSIANRDYGVVQACTFLIATIFLVVNLMVDLSYHYLDPRASALG
jgi:ABC-type dipeptide/oligopeptide/nickel transport system permease component